MPSQWDQLSALMVNMNIYWAGSVLGLAEGLAETL